nr:hypothetical protein [Tanacetum cinerariifolium]
MESPTPVRATQDLSALTRETTLDDQHGSNVLLPLFDKKYNQTMDMDDDHHGSNVLFPLFDQEEAGWHSRISRESVDLIELVDDEDGVPEDEEGSSKKQRNKKMPHTHCIDGETMAFSDQKNAYDAIMRHVDDNSTGVFFLDGPGGTGKTFLYKALLATVRSRGLSALAIASSGAAENNMTGRTAQSEVIDQDYIRIPDDMTIPYTNEIASKDALINEIFPSFGTNAHLSVDIVSRAILSTKNEHVHSINDMLIDRFLGEKKVYYSFDEAKDDTHNYYPLEFLNSLVSGLPPHHLRLKIGCPIILLRNLDPENGLCNGTRLICKRFDPNVINAKIAIGQHAGFLVRLSFAMTISKAQGQTIPNVDVYLPESVFSHGQLYVVLSRGISRTTTKVLVKPEKEFDQRGVYTSNVVYQEVLRDA